MAMPEYDLEKLPEVILGEIKQFTHDLIKESIAKSIYNEITQMNIFLGEPDIRSDWIGHLIYSLVNSMKAFDDLRRKLNLSFDSLMKSFEFKMELGDQPMSAKLYFIDKKSDVRDVNRLAVSFYGGEITTEKIEGGEYETYVLDATKRIDEDEMQSAADKLSKYFANQYIENNKSRQDIEDWIKKTTKKFNEGK